jgi:hypothetical protein
MTYMGRLKPDAPCSAPPGLDEWKPPHCVANKAKKDLKKLRTAVRLDWSHEALHHLWTKFNPRYEGVQPL